MAKPTTLSGARLLVLIGDGHSPEAFAAPCGLTTKSSDFSATSNSTVVPDCADEDAPAWTEKVVDALSHQVTGSGVLAVESFTVWNVWFLSGLAKNCRVKLDNAGLGYYSGSYILTGFKQGGSRGNKVTVDVTLQNDGQVTYTANS